MKRSVFLMIFILSACASEMVIPVKEEITVADLISASDESLPLHLQIIQALGYADLVTGMTMTEVEDYLISKDCKIVSSEDEILIAKLRAPSGDLSTYDLILFFKNGLLQKQVLDLSNATLIESDDSGS